MGSIALEEYELMKDSKYRVYVQSVDKALKSFEYTSEWADLISALGKLNKVLVSHTKFPVIPRRIKISKRLAQCMHPALPSGVHLRALETYDIIFKCMGTNRLSHELFIYSAGLFPLLGHAAMNVRPTLLTVYETHFVPLGKRLGPGLSGFLSGVLPGLEEGSDHFERTNSLLEKVCEGVGPSHFYGCLWDCLASNAAVRLPAISFALAHYDKRLSTEDQLHMMGTNVDIMVNGLCACVQDSSVLVQRSALDLLLVGFPMHNSQLLHCDMIRLVTAALSTILRRDMSLNRRLYAWLLGSEVNVALLSPEHPLVKRSKTVDSLSSQVGGSQYFELYSREMLVMAIKTTLDQATGQTPHDIRPYRLLVSLLDKPDIGPVILDDFLFEVFRLLYLCCNGTVDSGSSNNNTNSKSNSAELVKSANLLFGSLEPRYLWLYVGGLFANACSKPHMHPTSSSISQTHEGFVKRVGSGDPSLVEVCTLTEFLLDTVSLETYSETPTEHLPSLFLQIVTLLTEHCDTLSPLQTAKGLQLCAKILTRVQPTVVAHHSLSQAETGYASGEQSMGPESLQNVGKKFASLPGKVERSHSSLVTDLKSELNLDSASTNSDSLVTYGDYSENGVGEGDISDVVVTKERPKCASDEQNILEQCLRQYEKFYVTFVYGTRLKVGETKSISVLLESLKIKSTQASTEERAKQLESLLRAVMEDSPSASSPAGKRLVDGANTISIRRAVGNAGTEWTEAMKVASRLLVDLSTLQTFFQSPSTVSTVLEANISESCIDILPEWLRVLIVCACWLSSAVSLQLIAIATLLDLVTLCRTAQSLVASSNVDHQGVTPVLILPLLTPSHLRYIEHHTNIFQVIAHRLWGHLGSLSHRVKCVELLHQLQSALLTSDVVEDCLGEALSFRCQSESGRLMAFRRFATLWHIGREVNARLGNSLRVTDIFYKSMLKMMDNLQLPESSSLKVEAQSWLLHSLLRGDIHRILDPILMMLLDPATARLSVLHVRIQQHDEVVSSGQQVAEQPDKTTKIYAISSVDGNVIYHVSEKCHKGQAVSSSHKNPGKTKRVFAVTTLAGQDASKLNNRYITEKQPFINCDEPTDSYQTHSKNLSLLQNISVFVNPFSTDSMHKSDVINTDFDDYFEDHKEHNGELIGKAVRVTTVDLDKNKSKSVEGSDRLLPQCNERGRLEKSKNSVPRNNSFTSLDQEIAKSSLGIINPTLKLSSIDLDLLNLSSLSDSIFMKVSEGESITKDRKSRGSVSSDGAATGSTDVGGELVRSWSFPEKDHQDSGLDESTPAEDYFSGDTMAAVEELVSDLVDRVAFQLGDSENAHHYSSSISEPGPKNSTTKSSSGSGSGRDSWRIGHTRTPRISHGGMNPKPGNGVDHLHSHLLLYCGVYDSLRTLYALQTLRNILTTNARAFLCAAATTGLPSRSPLLKLMARHRKSIFGRGFTGDLDASSSRSSMYLEVLISTCLYYMRSYYPNLGQTKLTQDEISGNRQVQICSVELLSLVSCELSGIVRDSGHGLACYLADLLSRVKLQKVALHCVLSAVQQQQQQQQQHQNQSQHRSRNSPRSFTQEILSFNEEDDDVKVDGVSRHSEAFQVQLLRFLLALLMLEHEVNSRRGNSETDSHTPADRQDSATVGNELHYISGRVIPQQPMFLASIVRALELHGRGCHSHTHWTALVTCALPYLGPALTKVVTTVVKHICSNIESVSKAYIQQDNQTVSFPADYAITQVEALTVLCHYCLLDSATPFNQPLLAVSGTTPAQIFNNLIHVFMPSPILLHDQMKERHEPQQAARKAVLGSLPRVIASVAALWQALVSNKERESENVEAGSPRVVRQQLLEFLSPIALHHGTSFLAAIAVVWRERRPTTATAAPFSSQSALPVASEGQQVLVQLLSAIKAMPIDTLVQTLHQVVKQPALNQETAVSVEVSSLELFLHYVQLIPGASLAESWPSLLALLREGPALSPPAQFLLLGALSQFVHRCPALSDKKDQKDLQDITAKLVESCSQIAGACLEQTTWLRRNLAVKEDDLVPPQDKDFEKYEEIEVDASLGDCDGDLTPTEEKSSPGKTKSRNKSKLKRVTKKIRHDAEKLQIRALHQWFMRAFVHETNLTLDSSEASRNGSGSCSVAQYSVAAQTVLAQLLAPLLDVSYGSQEKERVVTLLTTMMYNITPYLKNHSQRNAGSFFACSQIIASLSSFQYTRKAWKKDAMDLLLDPTLFQMEARSLAFWRTTVDNLMSQDTATFRDLLARVCQGQGNSLSIFNSREQEYEQRAQLLKRLAFVILCSERDQFHKHMPDIQEKLAESLRLPQVVPGVQAQVFLCFRVLLLRMSPHHVTSLWPIIVSEMVQVMLHMEHELSTDTEEFRRNNSSHIRLLSALDWSWVVNSNNGLHANGHPHWLQLQLAAAKLLLLAVQLPADRLPQFQMYRWAFVESQIVSSHREQTKVDFIPHVTRIARLMDTKFGAIKEMPATLLPSGNNILFINDLHPFFTAMSNGYSTGLSLSEIEADIELDFLESMPAR